MRTLITIYLSVIHLIAQAQQADSVISQGILEELTVIGQKSRADIHQLPEVVGTSIYAGKKSALLVLDNVHGNLATNAMRQVAVRIPGLYIWENEGSGIQINIAARGLSPNRSWEFNVRQNGYDIAADPFGYPEAYYNPQLQAVQRIEVVRGHGALQYGAQIGGMVNYILKDGIEFRRPLQTEIFQTIGSNGLYNSYTALGGTNGRFHYYGFVDYRQGEGWRENNRYGSLTGSGSVTWKPVRGLELNAQFTRWKSDAQQPGGLTDEQFRSDARQSLRSRNWFGLTWQTAAFSIDYRPTSGGRFQLRTFHIAGDRSSVGFIPSAGILAADEQDPVTGHFAPRTVDIDVYRNLGMEGRGIRLFQTGRISHTVSGGFRLFTGATDRFRGGVGSAASDADFRLTSGQRWRSDIDYRSDNAAAFVEDLIGITPRLMLIPGLRLEYVGAEASGIASRNAGSETRLVPQQRGRTFLLAGLGAEYHITATTRIYANSTQSYRPVQFADLTTPPTTDEIDPDLTDASGLNTDIGWRGNYGDRLIFDVSAFHLDYSNRIGTIQQQRQDGSFYNLKTNIGRSRTIGLEFFSELCLLDDKRSGLVRDVKLFVAGTWMNARYRDLRVITVSNGVLMETNRRDNKVEYAPDRIIRAGITSVQGLFSAAFQISRTAEVYTDANNTEAPSANAQNGLIPAYTVADLTVMQRWKNGLSLKAGINNLFDTMYFTRRASGYPGPGVLPGEGRTFFLTAGYRFPDK